MILSSCKFVVIFAISLVIISCEKDNASSFEPEFGTFGELITVEPGLDTIMIGDTLWISASFNEKQLIYETQEVINIENGTFVLSGFVNSLKENSDSIGFIHENFELIEDVGEIMMVNVVDKYDQVSFNFDIKFGISDEEYKMRFGLVSAFEALYAMEFEGVVFYGANRNDNEDYSESSEKAFIDMIFENENVNDSLYYTLPYNYQQHYSNYYNAIDILNNEYYFFEVIESVSN